MKSENKTLEALFLFFERHPRQTYKARELARVLQIPNAEYRGFKLLLRKLAEEGKISRVGGNRFGLLRKPSIIEGILHLKTQGYGFLVGEDGEKKVFIPERWMGGGLHRDWVRVEILSKEPHRLPEGRVIEILKRGRSRIIGTFQEEKKVHYVIPDEIKFPHDIAVYEEDRNGAEDGDRVVVEIVQSYDTRRLPEGRIVEVLGRPDEKGVDVRSVIVEFDLPEGFPKAVEEEASQLDGEIRSEDILGRKDFRDTLVFTIDPEDAKDFDDAVSLEKTPKGTWKLGVHIADVSHFVKPGTAIDREAMARGTSVYLVDRVIPMLPERLSGNLCSLRPNEDRLTFSVFVELSEKGELLDYEINPSIIRSRYRLTYREAQTIIDEKPHGKTYDPTFCTTLQAMRDLSQLLLAQWKKQGMIDFELPEAEIILDENGFPVEIKLKERLQSHRLIEAFMLLANRIVTEHVLWLKQKYHMKLPFVFRVHEKPSREKLSDFSRFVSALGYSFRVGKNVTAKKFQTFLESIRNTAHAVVIEDVALRTMMKAQYATRNVGHFGLAFSHYTHFTSPIRRYPDLVVHRLLSAYASDPPTLVSFSPSLSEICKIATEREILAQEAERESVRAKQVEFMEQFLGEEFDGIISGVTGFGIFVEIPEYLIEGLVHISDLVDDYYVYDPIHYRLVGRHTGFVYRLGDSVRVRVARVLKNARKIDFVLVSEKKSRKKTG